MLSVFAAGIVFFVWARKALRLPAVIFCIGLPAVIWSLSFLIFVEEFDPLVHFMLFVPPLFYCSFVFWPVLLVAKLWYRTSWLAALFYALLSFALWFEDILVWDILDFAEPGVLTAMLSAVIFTMAVFLLHTRTTKVNLVTKDIGIVIMYGMALFAFINIYKESGPNWLAWGTLLEFSILFGSSLLIEKERTFPKPGLLVL